MTRRAIGLLRRLGLVGASLATLWAGMTLVWALVRPGVVEQIGTGSLAGVVALLAAPGLALAALRLDSRVARAQSRTMVDVDAHRAGWSGRGARVTHGADVPRSPRQSRRARGMGDPLVGAFTAD